MYDATGTLVLWNQQFFELFGGTREEMVTQGFLHYIVPDDRVKARKMFDDLLLTGQTQSLELRVVPKTGICMPLVIRVSRFYKNGQPFIVGVAVDVTDRIKAEEETARQKEALRHLTRRLIQGYEDERRHIARELHDELGQSLTAVRTDAVYIANRMKDAEPDIHERAQAILKIAGRTYDVTHAIMKRLRPGVLDDLGLVDAVEDLIADWQHQHACIGFGLEIDGTFDDLGGETKIAIYRAVQECLTNVMRHSAATEVSIHLLRGPIRDDSGGADNTHVQLRVRDNGRGLSGTAREHMSKGFGLAGMRERVSGLNGTLVLNEPGGKGLEVEITIPLPKDMGLPGAAREDD
jgi:PAS domain S-box-containing protein